MKLHYLISCAVFFTLMIGGCGSNGSPTSPSATTPGSSSGGTATTVPAGLVGTFDVTITAGDIAGRTDIPNIAGRWRLIFNANGEFQTLWDRTGTGFATHASGPFTATDTQITITNRTVNGGLCQGQSGTYRWTANADRSLTLSVTSDSCLAVVAILTTRPLTKQ